MRITSLEIHNFKRLKGHRVIDFPDGIIGVTGTNGQGKSTIALAIAWALFGPEVLPTGKSDVVTWGAKNAFVRVVMEINGEEYHVIRQQDKTGSSSAQLCQPGDPVHYISRGIDPTNREVERLLGVDRVGFLTSVYARQEELAGLMSLTPANRVKTVLRLLGIEQLTSAIDSVRSQARDARKELEALRIGFEDPDDMRLTIEGTKMMIEECESFIAIHEENLGAIRKEQEDLLNESIQLVPKRKAYEIYQTRHTKAIIAFNSATAELRSAERALASITPAPKPGPEPEPVAQADLDDAMGNLASVRAEINQLVVRRENIENSSKCYACNRPFDHKADLSSQIFDINQRIDAIMGQDEDFYAQLTILKQDRQRRLEWELSERKYANYKANYNQALDRVEQARKVLGHASVELESLKDQVVEDVSKAYDFIQEKRLDTEIAAGRIRETLSTYTEKKSNLKTSLLQYEESLSRSEKLYSQINNLEKNVLLNEVTATELSSLKESMIAQAIPLISEQASRLVAKFTDGRYTEVVLTPNYEIQYRNDLGELKSFENLSGGEKDVFALALRLAIADLRADSIGVLLLDEVLESLDTDRQEATWGAIERLTNRYNQVFIITHVQAFKDRASTVITV